jgi:hypothetical protein
LVIKSLDPELDPYPDLQLEEKLDPEAHEVNVDPKP